jgi:hypothetical protein
MEEIKIVTIIGWSITIIGGLIFLLVGMVGFFISELWRTIRETRTKLDQLRGEHARNHPEGK